MLCTATTVADVSGRRSCCVSVRNVENFFDILKVKNVIFLVDFQGIEKNAYYTLLRKLGGVEFVSGRIFLSKKV